MPKLCYTTKQVGVLLHVCMQTIIDWENKGCLKAFKTVGGHRRILREDLVKFIKKYKMPMPKELKKRR